MENTKKTDGKTSTSKLFTITICDKCGRVEQEETEDYSECAYESDKMLSLEELNKALDNGNVGFSKHYKSCEGCAEYEYADYLQTEHEILEEVQD